jgi:rRNA maturation endonuclease Nob1
MICKHCNQHIIRHSNCLRNDPFSFCPYCGGDIKIESFAKSDLNIEDLEEVE